MSPSADRTLNAKRPEALAVVSTDDGPLIMASLGLTFDGADPFGRLRPQKIPTEMPLTVPLT
jgi:hypothetical protein